MNTQAHTQTYTHTHTYNFMYEFADTHSHTEDTNTQKELKKKNETEPETGSRQNVLEKTQPPRKRKSTPEALVWSGTPAPLASIFPLE